MSEPESAESALEASCEVALGKRQREIGDINSAEVGTLVRDALVCAAQPPPALRPQLKMASAHRSWDGESCLFLDAACGQLDELRRLLDEAHSRIKHDKAVIESLRGENQLLKQALSSAGSPAVAGAAARSHSTSGPGSSLLLTRCHVINSQPSRPGAKKKLPASTSVIVLDSDDEATEAGEGELEGSSHGTHEGEDGAGALAGHGSDGGDESLESRQILPAAAEIRKGQQVDDEELVFVSSSGELGGDLPHPRNLCPRHKFWAVADSIENVPADKEIQNRSCCENCYCYLCDRKGSECRRWAAGNWLSHCNAHAGIKVCKELRAVFRHGLAVGPNVEDALSPSVNCMKSAFEGLLKIHRAFETYKKGQEKWGWDDNRKKMCNIREHNLQLGMHIEPLASSLGVQLDAQLVAKNNQTQQHVESEVLLGDVAGYLYTADLLLGTVLSSSFARDGVSQDHASVTQAWNEYLRVVRSLSFILTVALLIISMHGSVPTTTPQKGACAAAGGQSGEEKEERFVHWATVKTAIAERFQQYSEHLRSAREKFCGEANCQKLEDALAAPKAACVVGWEPAGLNVGEAGRAEFRQAVVKALLAAGTPADLERFVCDDAKDMVSLQLIAGLVKRGLFDAACDAVLALAPQSVGGRSRSWLTRQQLDDVWSRLWSNNSGAGMRLALRGALGSVVPYRPDNDRLNPEFSTRCIILKKALAELCKRCSGKEEASAWQEAWEGGSPALLPSLASIRASAHRMLDEAGLRQHTPGQGGDKEVRAAVVSHCRDGIAGSAHGRLLCIEMCIEGFARLHGREDARLCTELERMCSFLVATLGHAGGLVSLMNSLHPKPRLMGGLVCRRRRSILHELLKHTRASAAASSEATSASAGEQLADVGLGGWGADKAASRSDGDLVLTAALDKECLADLRSDDLSGTLSENAAVAKFCLVQALEGCRDEALAQARALLKGVKGQESAGKRASGGPALCDMFWAALFQLIPFADTDEKLRQELVTASFYSVPCAATAAALLEYPPDKVSIFDARKHVAAGMGVSAHSFPLAFGCYAVLGFKESAMQCMGVACGRLPKSTIFSEAKATVRALGPLALETSPEAGSSTAFDGSAQSTSWIASIVEIISSKFAGCRGFLEMETAVLGILQVGALIEPGAILPLLQQHVGQVAGKVTKECARKPSAERMADIRAQFVEWLRALKQTYHTRPAVVSDRMRQLWAGVAFVHMRRAWPSGGTGHGGAAPDEGGNERGGSQQYRVRGPSLSSEWESMAADLKNKVGKKASIWRDVKAAGIAQ